MHIYLKFESCNLQSKKNLVHEGVDVYVQNALKLAYASIFNSKKFSGGHTPDLRERGGDGKKKEGSGAGEKEGEGEGFCHGCWEDGRP